MAVKGILWDNDGVLVNTEALYFQASAQVLDSVGVTLSKEDFAEISLRQGGSVFSLVEPDIPPERIETLRRERDACYSELLKKGVSIIAGVEETLRELHGGIRMGIVTSSRREHFDLIHRNSGLLNYFDFVLAREDYVQAKPHPEPYLAGLNKIGLTAADCLVVEDSPRGLASACAAQIRCLVVPGEFFSPDQFVGAERLLADVRDIPLLLNGSGASGTV